MPPDNQILEFLFEICTTSYMLVNDFTLEMIQIKGQGRVFQALCLHPVSLAGT